MTRQVYCLHERLPETYAPKKSHLLLPPIQAHLPWTHGAKPYRAITEVTHFVSCGRTIRNRRLFTSSIWKTMRKNLDYKQKTLRLWSILSLWTWLMWTMQRLSVLASMWHRTQKVEVLNASNLKTPCSAWEPKCVRLPTCCLGLRMMKCHLPDLWIPMVLMFWNGWAKEVSLLPHNTRVRLTARVTWLPNPRMICVVSCIKAYSRTVVHGWRKCSTYYR